MVAFEDGSQLNIEFLQEGGRVEVLSKLTRKSSQFLYEFCQTTGMLVTSTIDPEVLGVLPGQYHEGISQRWPTHKKIATPDELQEWLIMEVEAGRIV